MIVSLTDQWIGYSQLMIKIGVVFVGDANAHHSEQLKSVSRTDRRGRDTLDFFAICRVICRARSHCSEQTRFVMNNGP